jgi:hypothetical protein
MLTIKLNAEAQRSKENGLEFTGEKLENNFL